MGSNTTSTRIEKDSMGTLSVPVGVLYGASTERARRNFTISDIRIAPQLIRALGLIKSSAARANAELQLLEPEIADAIVAAAERVANGEFNDHFVVDVFQTGSGTSTNMNANEVIANVAIKALGGQVGSKDSVHPNDHVNKGQSSNDVIPSAIHIAAAEAITNSLQPALCELRDAFVGKVSQFWDITKTGRTHLQDATPIRLGQEFLGYQGQMETSIAHAQQAASQMYVLALGGTAVGTGIGTHPDFPRLTIQNLCDATGLPFKETLNHFQAQSTIDAIVAASGAMKAIAVSLLKITTDIRWLGSGPRAGIGELELPALQPGSSIMPGKVNPVSAESTAMVCAQVIGNDATITIAGQSGNFELNVMLPIAAHNLLESITITAATCSSFAKNCITGLQATAKGPQLVEHGLAIGTALAPLIGYDAAATIAKEAAKTGESIREVAQRATTLSSVELERILDPLLMTEPSSAALISGSN